MAKIKIQLDKLGQGKIMLDNKDISSMVTDLDFTLTAGDSPRLSLRLISDDIEIVSDMRKNGINVEEVHILF